MCLAIIRSRLSSKECFSFYYALSKSCSCIYLAIIAKSSPSDTVEDVKIPDDKIICNYFLNRSLEILRHFITPHRRIKVT